MADIREPLMQSIETIVNKKLQEIKFDRTELCTVIQRDKNDSNKYLVTSNGGLTYYAYVVADGVEYARDQKVYVTIPQGNYETRKIIIGKYSEEDKDKLVQYTKPFDRFVAQQGYTFPSSLSVNANRDKSEQKEEVTGTIRFGANTFTKEGFGVYDYIGLTTSITTNFGGTTGSFELQFTFKDNEGNILLNSPLIFKSNQVYGNPYYLVPALKIQHLFNFPKERIEDVTKIKRIDIKLIADHKFDYTGESQSIVIENFTLQFGYNKTNLQNGTLNLYTDNNLQYTTEDNKTLYCYLYENIITGYGNFSEYNNSEYEIYWLQYQLGYTKDLTKPEDEDIEESGAWWKTLKKYNYNNTLGSRPFNNYTFSFKPNLTLPEMRIKVAIVHKTNDVIDQYYESDVLTFTNTNTTPQVTGNATQYEDLRLTLLDTDNDGIYNEYGIDNKLLANVLYPKYRIEVSYLDGTKWEEENSAIRQVIWKIPKTGTMLTRPYTLQVIDGKKVIAPDSRWKDGAEVKGYGDRYENFYIYVSHKAGEGEDLDEAQGHVVWYGITNQFDYSRTNNIIECEIVRTPATAVEGEFRKTQHYGSFQFQFGTQGTSGTNFAFNIYPNRPGGLSWTGSDSLTFTARLESDGQEIEFNESQIEWFINSTNVRSGSKTYEVKNTDIDMEESFNYFAILTAELPVTTANDKRVILKAYYPIARMNIAFPEDGDYNYIQGASRIVYNFQGSDPTYDDKSLYKLFDKDNKEITDIVLFGRHFPISWDIIQKDSGDSSDNYPSLEPKRNGNILVGYKLKPLGSKQTKPKPCAVRAYAQIGGSTVDLYYQPLVILTNEYAFPFLNDWDGTTTIDQEGNKILSQIIGAGVVNSSNQYTGILMGALGKTRNDAKTGLYGLQNGTLRYKLDEDGAFYVGDENNNFISFNEGNGRSDLNQLVIKVKNFELDTNNLDISSEKQTITINSNAGTIPETYLTRIKIGKLYNNIYGIDSYEGSLWLFPCPASEIEGLTEAQRREKASLSFDGQIMRLQGRFYRKDTKDQELFIGDVGGTLMYSSSYTTSNNVNALRFQNSIAGRNSILTFGIEKDQGAAISYIYPSANNYENDTLYISSGYVDSLSDKQNGAKLWLTAGRFKTETGYWMDGFARIILEGNKRGSTHSSIILTAEQIELNEQSNNGVIRINTGDMYLNATNETYLNAKNISLSKYTTQLKFQRGTDPCYNLTISGSGYGVRCQVDPWSFVSFFCMRNGYYYYWENDKYAQINHQRGVLNFCQASDNGTGSGYLYGDWRYNDVEIETTGSDIKIKHSINSLSEKYSNFFDLLSPVSFIYKKGQYGYGDSQRTHIGFIANQIEQNLQDSGLTNMDFAGLVIQDKDTDQELYTLRYEEFIALNTWQIQKLKARVAELEEEIKEIKNEIN